MHEGKFGITCVNFNSGATRTCSDSRQVGTCLGLNTQHAKHMEKKSCKKEVNSLVSRVSFYLKENVLLCGSMM